MRISKKCEYALRFLIFLTISKEKIITLKKISSTIEIPFKFLTLIVIDLKKNNFVESIKGPGGGYHLSDEALDYTLCKIIEVIDGKINSYKINFKQIDNEEAAFTSQVIKETIDSLNQEIYKKMNNITLRDLGNKYSKIANLKSDFSI